MIAIKGFTMPKTCRDCKCYVEARISYDDFIGCVFTGRTYNWGLTQRPSDCPLTEIDGDLAEYMRDDGR